MARIVEKEIVEKEEILKKLLKTASKKWGGLVDDLKPAIEATAEAVWRVEAFKISPSEEPANPPIILHRRTVKTGG